MKLSQQANCMFKCTDVVKLLYKEGPGDGSCELKHLAVCDVALQCCAGRHILVCLWNVTVHSNMKYMGGYCTQ